MKPRPRPLKNLRADLKARKGLIVIFITKPNHKLDIFVGSTGSDKLFPLPTDGLSPKMISRLCFILKKIKPDPSLGVTDANRVD